MDAPTAEAWHIRPNGPLVGEVQVSGSKNAVTKHMVAAMLGTRPSTITNAPDVGDVGITAGILTSLGVGVDIDGDRITIDPVEQPGADVPLEFTGLNRIPILLLGPLLARNHEAFVPLVGGDRIGRRPVDFHIDALERMGAAITVSDDGIGMAPETLAEIESPFFTTKEHGTGLGLATCRSIAASAGGGLTIESRINEGTRVTVRLSTAAAND